jgi:chemotaxis protein methyltransferase CheR
VIEPPVVPLPIGTFLLLRDLIQDRLGIWFDEGKRDLLASKLSDRIASLGLKSCLEYFYLLKYDTTAADEWPRLSDALSVQETYFWREMDQVRALVDVLVPQEAAARSSGLRIWSAACATGEEPLTLAMALDEAGWFGRVPIEIVASDMSPTALEKASRGVYRERAFRALPVRLRDKYFTATEDGWRIDPALQSRVSFHRANLLNADETTRFMNARYIFCRNVFIYFSQATIKKIVGEFAERMPRPGFLFAGVAESLLRIGSTFELEQIGDAYLYVRR